MTVNLNYYKINGLCLFFLLFIIIIAFTIAYPSHYSSTIQAKGVLFFGTSLALLFSLSSVNSIIRSFKNNLYVYLFLIYIAAHYLIIGNLLLRNAPVTTFLKSLIFLMVFLVIDSSYYLNSKYHAYIRRFTFILLFALALYAIAQLVVSSLGLTEFSPVTVVITGDSGYSYYDLGIFGKISATPPINIFDMRFYKCAVIFFESGIAVFFFLVGYFGDMHFARENKRASPAWTLFYKISFVLAIIATRSLAGYFSFAIGTYYQIYHNIKSKLAKLLLLLIFISTLIIFGCNIDKIFESMPMSHSYGERTFRNIRDIGYIINNPADIIFGIGGGATLEGQGFSNQHAYVLIGFGAVGVALYILMFRKLWMSSRDKGLIIVLITYGFGFPFIFYIPFWIIASILLHTPANHNPPVSGQTLVSVSRSF